MSVFVYIIGQEGEFVKIGIAANPTQRAAQLQTGNPYPLDVVYVRRASSRMAAKTIEARTHQILSEAHMAGEWFGVTYSLAIEAVDYAAQLREVPR